MGYAARFDPWYRDRDGTVVQAIFQPGTYPNGQKVSDADMATLNVEPHTILPIWNYTIRPRTPAPNSVRLREVIL